MKLVITKEWLKRAIELEGDDEVAAEHGHVADRSKWRLVGPMHLAETREHRVVPIHIVLQRMSIELGGVQIPRPSF